MIPRISTRIKESFVIFGVIFLKVYLHLNVFYDFSSTLTESVFSIIFLLTTAIFGIILANLIRRKIRQPFCIFLSLTALPLLLFIWTLMSNIMKLCAGWFYNADLWELYVLFDTMLYIIYAPQIFSFFLFLTAFISVFYLIVFARHLVGGHLSLSIKMNSKFIALKLIGLILMSFPLNYLFLSTDWLFNVLSISFSFYCDIDLLPNFFQNLALIQFIGSLMFLISERNIKAETLMLNQTYLIKYAVIAFFFGHFGFLCSEIAFSNGYPFADLLRVFIPLVPLSLLLITFCKIIVSPEPLKLSLKEILKMMFLAFFLGFLYMLLLLNRARVETQFYDAMVVFVGIVFALFDLMLLFLAFGFALIHIIVWQFKRLIVLSKHIVKIWRYLQGKKTRPVVYRMNNKESLGDRHFLIYSIFQLFIYSLSIFAFFIKEAKTMVLPFEQLSIESTFHELLLQYFDVYIPRFLISRPELFYLIDNPLVFGFTFSLTLPLVVAATFLLIAEDSGLRLNSEPLSPRLLHKYVFGIYILSFLYMISTSGYWAFSIIEAFILMILEICMIAFALTVSRKQLVTVIMAYLNKTGEVKKLKT